MRILGLTLLLAAGLCHGALAEERAERLASLWTALDQSLGPMRFDVRRMTPLGEVWECKACGFFRRSLDIRLYDRARGYADMTDAAILARAADRCPPPNCTIAPVALGDAEGALRRQVFDPFGVSHRWTVPLPDQVVIVTLEENRNPSLVGTEVTAAERETIAAVEATILPPLVAPAP